MILERKLFFYALSLCICFVSCRPISPSEEPDSDPSSTWVSPSWVYIGDYTEDLSSAAASPFDIVRFGIRVGDDLDSVNHLLTFLPGEGVGEVLLEFTDTLSATDYHYLPACWRDIPVGQPLADTVYAYTKRVLLFLAPGSSAASWGKGTAKPVYIQISRDVSHGLLWRDVSDQLSLTRPMSDNLEGWQNQALYLKAAIRAVRECCPEAKIVLQTSKLGSTQSLHEQLPRLLTNWAELGIDYDVLSFYVAPAIRSSLSDFESGLLSLFDSESLSTFDVRLLTDKEFHFETFYPCSSDIPEDVFVRSASKVGYPYTPYGQRDYLSDWKSIINSSLSAYNRSGGASNSQTSNVPVALIYRHAASPSYFRLCDYQYLKESTADNP